MAAGNLRTAANNDQDDDPRALVPIPIATREMTSLVERLNPGVNAEVVRVSLADCFFSPTSLSLSYDRATNYPPRAARFCSSLSPKAREKVQRKGVGRLFSGLAIVEARNRSLRGRSLAARLNIFFSRRPIIFFFGRFEFESNFFCFLLLLLRERERETHGKGTRARALDDDDDDD